MLCVDFALQVLADVVYMRPEDEYYHKHCSWSFAFAVPNRPAGYEDMDQVRLCMLLTSAQVAAARWVLPSCGSNPSWHLPSSHDVIV